MRIDFMKRSACQTPSKILGISSAKTWVVPDLLKTLAIPSVATLKRSTI